MSLNGCGKRNGTYLHNAEHCKYKIHFITFPKSDIKPHVDEIIATEETSDSKEIPRVEKEKNTENNQQTAKKTHGKAAAARTVP